jgi:hypothetical protein
MESSNAFRASGVPPISRAFPWVRQTQRLVQKSFFTRSGDASGLIRSLPWAALPVFFGKRGVILTKCRCKTPDHSGFFNSSAELEILSSGKNVNRFYSVNFRTFAIIKSYQNT